MATERHTAVSLSCRSTSGARDCLECSGADSGLASLLGPTGFHYAGPGATRATAHRSVILLLSPQKTNVDVRRDLDHCVTVAIDRHPCGDTPQHPHDHRDHQDWQWCPRSQVDAGLTLGWSALVALVVVGAPPGTICLAPPLKPPRHRSHVLFVSLVRHTHAETGNSETGGANRDELLKEKAIFGQSLAIFGQQHYLTLVATTNSADVFSLFSSPSHGLV